jgi:cell division protein FtsL
MLRVTLLLLAVLIACALGLVTSQYKARKLFAELEAEQERARSLEIEYGQLQLEASTWSTQSRIERIASQRLRMRRPDPARVQLVQPPAESR